VNKSRRFAFAEHDSTDALGNAVDWTTNVLQIKVSNDLAKLIKNGLLYKFEILNILSKHSKKSLGLDPAA